MKVKTLSGIKCDIDERILDDWRFLKALKKADNKVDQSEAITGTVELVEIVFGKSEDAIMESIAKKNNGYIPQDAIKDELLNVIGQVKELKNSQSSQG